MVATAVKTHLVAPDERLSAKGVSDLLARAGSRGSVKLVVQPVRGRVETVSISESLLETIRELIGLVQGSEQVGMFADDPDVTPEQASDMLGMSRPTVVQRIKCGDIKARMVGSHHRIRMSDLLAFQRQEAERNSALADISARKGSVRFAVANTVMEGGTVLPETEAVLESWAQGEIDDDELMEQTLQRFGPGA